MPYKDPDVRRRRRRGRYTKRFEQLRAEFGGRCSLELEGCLKTQRLEFAHKRPTGIKNNGHRGGRGMPQRFHDIKNNPSAYILVCRNCHAKIDDLDPKFHNYTEEEVNENEIPF